MAEHGGRVRRDYFDDPAAPAPTALVTRVFVAVVDDEGRVLAHARDSGPWSLPGGALEVGESLEGCAMREVDEETGVRMAGLQIVTAVSDPGHVIVNTDGVPHQQVAVLACARYAGGVLRPSPESPVVRFLAPEEMDSVGFDPAQRRYLEILGRAVGWVPRPPVRVRS